MMRVRNWWPLLIAYVHENRLRARAYGEWDCWQMTGGGVLIETGMDHRSAFPQYQTAEEGARIIAANGGVEAMMTRLFGSPIHVSQAKRGDIVVSDVGEGLAGGLCFGVDTVTVFPTGVGYVKTLSGVAAWAV